MALKRDELADAVYLVGATTRRVWDKPVIGAELFSTGELGFAEMLESLDGWWEKYCFPSPQDGLPGIRSASAVSRSPRCR